MLKKRIIACLDIKNGRTVKGINFQSLKDMGDPVLLAQRYATEGIDELVFLDISATEESRKTLLPLVRRIANEINIPFTVGGGISDIKQVDNLLEAGADKISINSAAIRNPKIINEIAHMYGSQFIVVAVDTKNNKGAYSIYSHGGKKPINIEAIAWCKEAEERGAGEILLTSMDTDGTQKGFDLEITSRVANQINIPVIASGGAGKETHFNSLFQKTEASAGLAASIFHNRKIEIQALKKYLTNQKLPIRCN